MAGWVPQWVPQYTAKSIPLSTWIRVQCSCSFFARPGLNQAMWTQHFNTLNEGALIIFTPQRGCYWRVRVKQAAELKKTTCFGFFSFPLSLRLCPHCSSLVWFRVQAVTPPRAMTTVSTAGSHQAVAKLLSGICSRTYGQHVTWHYTPRKLIWI